MNIRYQFRLREPNANGPTSIRLQFYKDSHKFIFGTGLKVLPELWDFEKQRPKQLTKKELGKYSEYPQLGTELKQIENVCERIVQLSKTWFSKVYLTGETIQLSHLRDYLKNAIKAKKKSQSHSQPKETLFIDEMILNFIRSISNGSELTFKKTRYEESTIRVYNTLSNQFANFQDHLKKRFTLEDITSDLSKEWTNYLYLSRKDKKGKVIEGSSKSNVGKLFKHFKRVISFQLDSIDKKNYALEKKKLNPILSINQISRIKRGLKSFQNHKSDKTKIYLNRKELKQLHELEDLPQHLEIARDVFLIGAYSGLRYSDYSRIAPEHIKVVNGKKRLVLITVKTKQRVEIPIRPELNYLLEKYSLQVPKTYEQKLNKYIKEVGAIAGLTETIKVTENKGGIERIMSKPKYSMITSHTARRSALTQMYLSGECTTKEIMTISGHKTLASFETYLRIGQEESIRRMENSSFFRGANLKVVGK